MSEPTTTVYIDPDDAPHFTLRADYELESAYDEMLDEVYGTVTVAGYEYDTARTLKEVDPIAYRTGRNDYADRFTEMQMPDDLYLSHDGEAINDWVAANL